MTGTEIEITADLVRDLLQEQHPDLAGLAIREVAGGWGNQMWRLGDELAVRMQRMDRTPELQLKERRWLPVLAPLLPLPVPVPVRFGEPSGRFPKHWTVMTWVPGEPLDHGSISRGAHAADTLAGFLRALHVEAPAEAPIATDRGAHPRNCTDGFENFFQAVAPGDIAAGVRAVWDDAVAARAWEGPPVWVHGDLHPANVVVSGGTLSGIVDFGDMFAGDPAWDLAAAWVLLPAGTASRFFDMYAQADEAAIRRARGLAALKSLFLVLMGQNGDRGLPGGKPHWGPADRAALDRVGVSVRLAPPGTRDCVDPGQGHRLRADCEGLSRMPVHGWLCAARIDPDSLVLLRWFCGGLVAVVLAGEPDAAWRASWMRAS